MANIRAAELFSPTFHHARGGRLRKPRLEIGLGNFML
jgi:hypothetical protein